jgi:hypothetical protein
MYKKPRMVPAILFAAAVFPLCAIAGPLNGGINFSGDVTVTTNTTTGAGTLTFNQVAGQTYTFVIDSATGDFAGLSGGGKASTIGTSIAPVDTPLDIPDFLMFNNDPTLSFTLTYVYAGVDNPAGCFLPAAPGVTCTPPNTPYNLQDLAANNASASFVVQGFLLKNGVESPATVTFTAASTGESFQDLLANQAAGGSNKITYGAQLITIASAPEPATYSSIMLGGILVLAGVIRRRRLQ